MDLYEYGQQMSALMEAHRKGIQASVTAFIAQVREQNEQTNAEITRLSSSLIGTENGPTDKKSPSQISSGIFS